MRKLLAILLLSVHLFNMGGYRFVFAHLEQQAASTLVSKLDKEEYNEKDLVEVKVPISLPYQVDWKEFERYDGEIEINGVHYNYVKRKVQNDSLVLMCIPNGEKTKITNAREEFFSLVNNLQQNSDGKAPAAPKSTVIKTITTDYNQGAEQLAIANPSIEKEAQMYFNEKLLPSVTLSSPAQPPEC